MAERVLDGVGKSASTLMNETNAVIDGARNLTCRDSRTPPSNH